MVATAAGAPGVAEVAAEPEVPCDPATLDELAGVLTGSWEEPPVNSRLIWKRQMVSFISRFMSS